MRMLCQIIKDTTTHKILYYSGKDTDEEYEITTPMERIIYRLR